VAYAKEGARIYDGHQPGQVLTTLKRAKIRGVESYSMVCSEKNWASAKSTKASSSWMMMPGTGMPLVDYMGDAILEVNINPNMARNASVLGLARESPPSPGARSKSRESMNCKPPASRLRAVKIEIDNPQLNPRFTLG
jgi:phenylalanyl-tRNA synthetase beta chain